MATQFGEHIRELRTKQNLLLQQLASQLDADTSIISMVERGDRQLKREQIPLLAQILKADVEALQTLWLANPQEKELLLNAKPAIRVGKFQNLQRDMNKLAKAVKASPLKPAILLEEVIKVLNKYPLQAMEDDGMQTVQHIFNLKEFNPEIIISKSFDNY